jgi:hypothetical protein
LVQVKPKNPHLLTAEIYGRAANAPATKSPFKKEPQLREWLLAELKSDKTMPRKEWLRRARERFPGCSTAAFVRMWDDIKGRHGFEFMATPGRRPARTQPGKLKGVPINQPP